MKIGPVTGQFLDHVVNRLAQVLGRPILRRSDLCRSHDLDSSSSAKAELFQHFVSVDETASAAT